MNAGGGREHARMRPGRSQVPNRLRVAGRQIVPQAHLGIGWWRCARPGRLAAGDGRTVCAACSAFVDAATWSSLNRQCRNPNPFPCPSLYRSSYSSLNPGSACLQGSDATSVPAPGGQRAAGGKLTCCCIAETAAFFRVDLHAAPVADQTQRSGTPPTPTGSPPKRSGPLLCPNISAGGASQQRAEDGTCAMRDWMVSRAANCRRPKLCVVLGRGVVLGLRPPSGAVVQHPCPCGSKLTHSNP